MLSIAARRSVHGWHALMVSATTREFSAFRVSPTVSAPRNPWVAANGLVFRRLLHASQAMRTKTGNDDANSAKATPSPLEDQPLTAFERFRLGYLLFVKRLNRNVGMFIISVFASILAFRLLQTREETSRSLAAKDKQLLLLAEKLALERAAATARQERLQSILNAFQAKLADGALIECQRMRSEVDSVFVSAHPALVAQGQSTSAAPVKTSNPSGSKTTDAKKVTALV